LLGRKRRLERARVAQYNIDGCQLGAKSGRRDAIGVAPRQRRQEFVNPVSGKLRVWQNVQQVIAFVVGWQDWIVD
jgi:hypothetical protein